MFTHQHNIIHQSHQVAQVCVLILVPWLPECVRHVLNVKPHLLTMNNALPSIWQGTRRPRPSLPCLAWCQRRGFSLEAVFFCSNQSLDRYLTENQKAKEDELFGPFAGNDGRTCQISEYKFKYLHVDLHFDCKSSFVSSTSSHRLRSPGKSTAEKGRPHLTTDVDNPWIPSLAGHAASIRRTRASSTDLGRAWKFG